MIQDEKVCSWTCWRTISTGNTTAFGRGSIFSISDNRSGQSPKTCTGFLDIRSNSNTANDFAMFITLAVASGFFKPGDYLVYDNVAVHFGANTFQELQQLFEQHGITTIPLPTYSRELNPIERCFGVVKHYLRYQK